MGSEMCIRDRSTAPPAPSTEPPAPSVAPLVVAPPVEPPSSVPPQKRARMFPPDVVDFGNDVNIDLYSDGVTGEVLFAIQHVFPSVATMDVMFIDDDANNIGMDVEIISVNI